MSNIKKSMVAVLAFVIANGRMSKENLALFTEQFCVAKGETSAGPREITILKDINGEQLGRKCTATNLFFANEAFSKGAVMIKTAEALKAKLYTESKKMETAAQSLLAEAKGCEDVGEKIAKYEAFDSALEAAKQFRAQPIEVTDEMKQGGFATIEELASALGVEVNPQPAKVEVPTED